MTAELGKFAVVTDSAADLPPALAEKYGIHVVPLHVTHGLTDYRDGVDIQIGEFLDLLAEGGALPVTSQPSPADYLDVYKGLLEAGYTEVLSIHLSSALSATIQTAHAIAAKVPEGLRLEVFDSLSASVEQGAMALEAARIAQTGGTLDEALERVQAIREAAKIYFTPDTLDNLVKGGRATRLQGAATSLLNIKLVIEVAPEGGIDVVSKGRGTKSAASYMAKGIAARSAELGPLVYYTLSTRAPKALELLGSALEKAGVAERDRFITCGTIGPAIATHVGLGAMGIFAYPAALHDAALDEDIARWLTPEF